MLLVDLTYLQAAVGCGRKVVVHEDVVVNVPDSPVCKRAVAVREHVDEGGIEVFRAELADFSLAVHPYDHALVGGVVVHVAHDHDLDAGNLLFELLHVIVDDLGATGTEVGALASHSRGEMGHIYGDVLSVNLPVHHEDVAGLEGRLLLLVKRELYPAALEGEGDGLAVEVCELVGPVEQGHVDAARIRTVVVDNLIVGAGQLGQADEILEHEAVLDLADTEKSMVDAVLVAHGVDYARDVGELLLIFRLRPLVPALGEELGVVRDGVVVDVEKVLNIVEPYDVVLLLREA